MGDGRGENGREEKILKGSEVDIFQVEKWR
jgi:hypothetical protein